MLALDHAQELDLDHTPPVGDHAPKGNPNPEFRSDRCVQRNICSEIRGWSSGGVGGVSGQVGMRRDVGGAYGFGSGGVGEVVAGTGVEDRP